MSIEDLSAHWKDRAEFSEAKVERLESRIVEMESVLKPWGSGGIITGTVLAWIAAKDPSIARNIVFGKAAVDRALNP